MTNQPINKFSQKNLKKYAKDTMEILEQSHTCTQAFFHELRFCLGGGSEQRNLAYTICDIKSNIEWLKKIEEELTSYLLDRVLKKEENDEIMEKASPTDEEEFHLKRCRALKEKGEI